MKNPRLIIKIGLVVLIGIVFAVSDIIHIQNQIPGIDSAINERCNDDCQEYETEMEAPPVVPSCPVLPQIVSSIASSRTQGAVNDTVTFTFVVTNPESVTAKGVEVLAIIPEGFDVINFSTTAGQIGYNANANYVKASMITLKANESVTVTVTAKMNNLAQSGMTSYIAARIRHGSDCDSVQFFTNWLPIQTV